MNSISFLSTKQYKRQQSIRSYLSSGNLTRITAFQSDIDSDCIENGLLDQNILKKDCPENSFSNYSVSTPESTLRKSSQFSFGVRSPDGKSIKYQTLTPQHIQPINCLDDDVDDSVITINDSFDQSQKNPVKQNVQIIKQMIKPEWFQLRKIPKTSLFQDTDLKQKLDRNTDQNEISYLDILLQANSPWPLLHKYIKQEKHNDWVQQQQQSTQFSFELEDCFQRAQQGYSVWKYDYKSIKREKLHLIVNKTQILWRKANQRLYKSKTHLDFRLKYIQGIILGTGSSTFSNFKGLSDQKSGKLHESWDCFSLVTQHRCYDFGTAELVARLDIVISISWAIFLHSSPCSCIPITQSTYLKAVLRMKIAYSAFKRNISVNELILVNYTQLAMYKTTYDLKDEKRQDELFKILQRKFTATHRFFRLVTLIMDSEVKANSKIRKQRKESRRLTSLNHKRILQIGKMLKEKGRLEGVFDTHDRRQMLVLKRQLLNKGIAPGFASLFVKKNRKTRTDSLITTERL